MFLPFPTFVALIIHLDLVASTPIKITGHTSRKRDVVTTNVLPLRRTTSSIPDHQTRRRNSKSNKRCDCDDTGEAPLNWQISVQNLLTTIAVDGEDFSVLVDTASSDTWLATTNLTCLSPSTRTPILSTNCAFGNFFKPTNATQALSLSLNITYSTSQSVSGHMALSSLSLAGYNLSNFELGLVNSATWPSGDGITSGVLGLAFPSITSAFMGTDPTTASGKTQVPYNNFMTRLFEKETDMEQIFSLAVDRATNDGTSAGWLAFGGLPPVSTIGEFVSTPVVKATTSFFNGTKLATPEYQFWSIVPDGFVYIAPLTAELQSRSTRISSSKLEPGTIPERRAKTVSQIGEQRIELRAEEEGGYIIGSASTYLSLPTHIANEINNLFSPPAVKSPPRPSLYTIPCNATAPTVGIEISNTVFWIQPQDLIVKQKDGSCVSGVVDKGNGRSELGDVWLRNVVVVFDGGLGEVRVAQRAT